MVIVETEEQYTQFKGDISNGALFAVPTYSDQHKHVMRNNLSLLYVYVIEKDVEYLLPFNHSEAECREFDLCELFGSKEVFIFDKKGFSKFMTSETFYDANLVEYFKSNRTLDIDDADTTAHDFLSKHYRAELYMNEIVPIVKHYQRCKSIKDRFVKAYDGFELTQAFKYYNTLFINTLYNIEKWGLFVDYKLFIDTFGRNGLENNLTFSEYNIYTTTGRPSNRYGGINYAALNKENGTRSVFISRFEKDGFLLQYDYDAYHLRLIADMIGYKFPAGVNIHEYLGKQYFNVDSLTSEQYGESKQISFRQLYGGVQAEYKTIPYFNQVSDYIESMWQLFERQGYIKTPLFNRIMKSEFYSDLNRNKLFNYVLQNLETERNMLIIDQLHDQLKDYKSKLILYTYDSILFDFNQSDGKEFILKVKDVLEQQGKYPTKAEIGADYHEMKSVEI